MYLGECPNIYDGRHYHGNELSEKKRFCFLSLIFHTGDIKGTLA